MRKIILSLAVCSWLLVSCSGNDKTGQDLVSDNFAFAEEQLNLAIETVERLFDEKNPIQLENNKRPYVAPRTIDAEGNLVMVRATDWTSGFFSGELWYLYEYTGDDSWRERAEEFTGKLEDMKYFTGNHDIGFMMYCSYGNGYRLTGNPAYRDILIQSAETQITRYDPAVGAIRSWDFNKDRWQYPVIIDNMMNLELLFWAAKATGDDKFREVAVNHANKTLENHFRDNYSSYHVISYDLATGLVEKKNTWQGYEDESAWSRGQAWGLYGFTMCYRETGDQRYLQQARNIARFIFTNPNLPDDLIPYWDYDVPEIINEPRDVSAASITASALYELSEYCGEDGGQYKEWADTIIRNLTDNYRAQPGGDYGFLLLHSTGAKSLGGEVDVPLVYADYYFLEALLRKNNL